MKRILPQTIFRSSHQFKFRKMAQRNKHVENSVAHAISLIDEYIDGKRLGKVPSRELREVLDKQLSKGGSICAASLFFAFYSLHDAEWDHNSIPTGLRGKWGDKGLADDLNLRHLTLHGATKAFGENLGWKGDVTNFNLSTDGRFSDFVSALKDSDKTLKSLVVEYVAARFAESKKVMAPLPPVGKDILTYTRARVLFSDLVTTPSEGHIQQFLIAGLLRVHRKRYSHEVKTHHPHGSDKSSGEAGDIEEYRDKTLVAAYEITVRADWKNRVTSFREKMDNFGLSKYVIFASDVNNDEELAKPAEMLKFLEPYGRDIAVVDILDAIHVFCAELSADELRTALATTYDYLSHPKLCGRADIIDNFSTKVADWLDEVAT